jgi:hypothetical protein
VCVYRLLFYFSSMTICLNQHKTTHTHTHTHTHCGPPLNRSRAASQPATQLVVVFLFSFLFVVSLSLSFLPFSHARVAAEECVFREFTFFFRTGSSSNLLCVCVCVCAVSRYRLLRTQYKKVSQCLVITSSLCRSRQTVDRSSFILTYKNYYYFTYDIIYQFHLSMSERVGRTNPKKKKFSPETLTIFC